MSSDFTFTSIGSACEISTGFPFKSNDYCAKSESIKLLRGDNIAQGTLRWDGVKRWNPEELEPSVESKYSLRSGDVVVAMDRPWIEAGLKFAAIQESDLPCLLVQRVACLRAGESIDQGFLKYVVSDYAFTTHVLAVQTGTAVPHISSKQIAEYEFAAPPLPEQKAIAHILGTLDDKIELNRKTNETLEAMAKTLFKSWFVDFDPVRAKAEGRPTGLPAEISDLFPDSFEDSELGEIPSGWEVGGLEEFLVLQRGFDLPAPQRIKGAYPVVAASGVSGTHNEPMAVAPGVVTGRSGVLGKVFYIQTDFFPLNTTLWAKEFRLATPIYGYFLLCDIDFAVFNAGSAVPTLNRNHLGSLRFPLPPRALVVSFTEVAVDLMKRREGIVAETSNLSATRDALLPKLISGEIRIPDAKRFVSQLYQ